MMSSTGRSKYTKAMIIAKDVFPKILIEYIDNPQNPMPPQTLHAMVKRDKFIITKLSHDEMRILPTLMSVGYKEFDFSLLYKLIRYFNLVNPPNRGWGNQPQGNDIEVGDDIERLRKSRNSIVHMPRAELSMVEEQEFYNLTLEAAKRADYFLRKHPDHGFQKEIMDIQIKSLDSETEEKYIKALEEVVQLKRQCSKTIGRHEVNMYYGKDIQMSLGKDSENKNAILYVSGLKESSNKDEVVRILNELKENINNGNYGIIFESAETGSVLVYITFLASVLNSAESLHTHAMEFLKHMFSHYYLCLLFKETVDVSLFINDFIDPQVLESSFIEEYEFDLSSDQNKWIKFNVQFNQDALESSETFHSVATSFIDRIQRQTENTIQLCGDSMDLVVQSTSKEKDHIKYKFQFENCDKHGFKIIYYCSYHDQLACKACFHETHSDCSGLKPIDQAAKYAKTSAFVMDFEERINEALVNIEEVIRERQSHLVKMLESESQVRKKIKDLRQAIDLKLDKMENTIATKLTTKYTNFDNMTRKTINQLKDERTFILQMKREVVDKKEELSGQDVFVGAHKLNDALLRQEEKMDKFLEDLVEVDFAFKKNTIIDRLVGVMDSFGDIETNQRPSTVKLMQTRRKEAQLHIPGLSLNNDLEFSQHRLFHLGELVSPVMYSCVILPDQQYVFVNNIGNCLIICKTDGKIDRKIELSGSPRYLAKMEDFLVAITYDQLKVDIFDLATDCFEKRILISTSCNGIHYQDGKFYLLSNQVGIEIIDKAGNLLQSIPICIDFAKDIVISEDKIYLTDWEFHTVQCRDRDGKLIWKYNGKDLKYPRGLAIDEYKNIFVASGRTNRVLCLTRDGEYCRTILSEVCLEPSGVFYSRELKQLLISDLYSGTAHLLKVQYGINTRFFTVL